MTYQEIIKTLEVAKAEVEWNYPLNYTIAIDEAIEIIKKQCMDKSEPYNPCDMCEFTDSCKVENCNNRICHGFGYCDHCEKE